MIWNNNNLIENIKIEENNTDKEKRKEIIKNNKGICKYCGGKYKKYLYCVKIEKKYEILCKLCYIIGNDTINENKIDIYKSNKSQREIIRETVKGIEEENRIKKPKEIDNKAEKKKLSVIEYRAMIRESNNEKILKNIKYFFNDKVNINFIDEYGFDDEDNEKDEKRKKIIEDEETITEDEKIIIDKYLK